MLFGQQPVSGADLGQSATAVKAERSVVVGSRPVQLMGLLGDGVHVGFADNRRFFTGGQQLRAFEQAAKIFFAGDNFRASLAGEAGVGLVFHFQSFEADNADELAVFFPDLGLREFHDGDIGQSKRIPRGIERGGMKLRKKFVSPVFSGETITCSLTSFSRLFWQRLFSGRVCLLWI